MSQWQREMSAFWKVIVARPLIAIALAAIVVAVIYFGFTRRETTPVTHRTERVGLTEQQQMQLGNEQYQKTLHQYPNRIISSGAAYTQVQRVAKRIEAVAARDKPSFVWKVTSQGKSQDLAGNWSYTNGVLTLAQADQRGALVGNVAWQAEDKFGFRALGTGPDDPGLSFTR